MSTLIAEKISCSVRKRDGKIVPFDSSRIERAITAAFQEYWDQPIGADISKEQKEVIEELLNSVIEKLRQSQTFEETLDVERVQDVVELILMRRGHYEVAKGYIVYRDRHARARSIRSPKEPNSEQITSDLKHALKGLEDVCSLKLMLGKISNQLFDDITEEEIRLICLLTAKEMIEKEPAYDKVAVRFLHDKIDREILGSTPENRDHALRSHFQNYISLGIKEKRLTEQFHEFDLKVIANALKFERDDQFGYLGLQALYDRYLLNVEGVRIETPQYFWMRVAMGLTLHEKEKEQKAIEFYELLSTFRYVSSTPTLFNSGTLYPQLSSCYLSTVDDDIESIFNNIAANAKLSKWAGGLGNDWTPIRATNSLIKGTNGKSQGVIPFLKIVNDTAVAVNQGGKRKGAVCCYLETWHLDIEEFLDLRKNTGDERRRTHDMNTANWIPDLFMKRVKEDGVWTLFSPNEVPDLHDLYGEEFVIRYKSYEKMADEGKLAQFKQVQAKDLWRKMLSRLFETGHPWITFKDPSNLRSMQSHAGVIHSSNLCTEILLNTNQNETAVCNLGSVNLVVHLKDGKIDEKKLKATITTAVRMLDNVIDINFYPTEESKNSNLRHRPIGLGLMGFQDALHHLKIPYDSNEAVEFADISMELISYYAIQASSELAKERAPYSSYKGSKWSQGKLPIDTLQDLEKVNTSSKLNWKPLRQLVQKNGMRNSHVLAIAPTATISLIVGTSQSIEPAYAFLYTKSNLSGETCVANTYLVNELKDLNLWDQEMLDELKYHDGSIQQIERIPNALKDRYKTAFEISPNWLIESASRRQKWIDMGQSLNLYLSEPSGKKLHEMYFLAWEKGLKTTYYLRTRAATQVEKSTLDVNKFGIQPKWMKNKSASSKIQVNRTCSLDEGCEVCQ